MKTTNKKGHGKRGLRKGKKIEEQKPLVSIMKVVDVATPTFQQGVSMGPRIPPPPPKG